MTYSDAIIKRLTDLCVERGITTNKLATLSGITQSTLNSMMRGETKNPKLKTLRKIAMGLNMTVSELLDFPEMNEMEFEDEWKWVEKFIERMILINHSLYKQENQSFNKWYNFASSSGAMVYELGLDE